jgi:hypothetical protein
MNYLFHFALAPSASAAFGVGGALPDLSRLRGKGFRLKAGHWEGVSVPILTDLQTQVEAGIARHYEVDGWWHNSAVFGDLQGQVRQAVLEAGISVERLSFLCHIGAEMLLDRALLHRDPALASRFYACFQPDILDATYELVRLKGQETWIPRLQTGVDSFVKRRFLEDYAGIYLSRTWPDIYQHVTHDASACTFSEAQWMEVVDRVTHTFLEEDEMLSSLFHIKY